MKSPGESKPLVVNNAATRFHSATERRFEGGSPNNVETVMRYVYSNVGPKIFSQFIRLTLEVVSELYLVLAKLLLLSAKNIQVIRKMIHQSLRLTPILFFL